MAETDSRRYPKRPIVGVGALIRDGQGRTLLIQRGKEPLKGSWTLPGGAVEPGERLEEAVCREVLEETGLQVSAGPIATVFERIMPDAEGACEYHYVLIDFYCTMHGGTLQAATDCAAVDWFSAADLDGLLLTEGTRHVLELCSFDQPTHPHVTRP